jgi:hypothetical protein
MDSSTDDVNEILYEEIIASDSYEDESGVELNDDLDKDAEDDQVFDEKLDSEIEQGNEIASEPEETLIFDDEEKDGNESGLEDSIATDTDREVLISPPTITTVSILF